MSTNRDRAATVGKNSKSRGTGSSKIDLEMMDGISPTTKTQKSKGAAFKAEVERDEKKDFDEQQRKALNISRSHSLDESIEDPTEHLIEPIENKRDKLRGRTSDEMYQKELAMAFPFLKKIDYSRRSNRVQLSNRASKRQDERSEQLEFNRSSKNSNRASARNRIMKQQTFKAQTDRLQQEQNLNSSSGFGLGIISFHQFIVYSGILFFLLTLMHVPTFWILLSYDKDYEALDGMNSAEDKSLLERVTLGNLGFSSAECQTQAMMYTSENHAKLRCKSGVLTTFIDFGVTTKAEDQQQCRKQSSSICSKYLLDKGPESIYKIFDRDCKGKDSCIISNFDKFLSRKGDAQEVYACLSPESRAFFQYTCEQTPAQLENKFKDARTLVYIELSCIAVVVIFIFFVKHRTQVLANRYIRNHVQAMDYTMFFPIKRSQLKKFDQEVYKPNSSESRGTQFKNHITEHLSELTSSVVERSADEQEMFDADQNAQITRVDLVFDNNNLLNLLKKRGRAIMYEDKEQVQEFEEIINNKEYKDRQYFCNIVGVFVTYERKDDVVYIHKAAKKKSPFLGKKIKIKQAEQPYQYAWENMAFTAKRRCMGFCCSMLLLSTFLLIAFTIQFKMQKTVAYFDNYEKADCNVFADSVAVTHEEQVKTPSVFIIPQFTDVRFQREAYHTWKNFYEEVDSSDMTRRYINSTLSCFCEIKFSKWSYLLLFASYRSDGLDQSPTEYDQYMAELKKKGLEDEIESDNICSEFLIYSKMSQNYFLLMSLVIFLFNLGLYEMTGPILSITGFKRKNEQQNLVSIIIMICLLIDTILIPVMIGANFVEYGNHSVLDQIFTGKNTDFGRDWYPDVGYGFVITMTLYILNPFFTVFAEWGDLKFRHCWRRRYNKKLKAKQDMQDLRYFMFDIGPIYIMDYKIASTTSLFFIAIVFGPLVPLLYPMALLAIILQYWIEVWSLRRFYKLNQAQKQDEQMTQVNLKMLLAAPLIGLAVNIWAYSNRQMFENKIDPVKSIDEVVLSHHLLTDKNYPNYSHVVILWLGLTATAGIIALVLVQQYFIRLAFNRKKFKNMPNYLDSLKIDRCEEIVQDEKFFNKVGGFSVLPQKAMTKLEKRLLFKDFDGEGSKVQSTFDSQVPDRRPSQTRRERLNSSFNISSGSFFGSGVGNGPNNQLVGQPSYQVFYDIDYQFHFNDKDPQSIKAIKLLLMLPMVEQQRLESIKLTHYKYGKGGKEDKNLA